MADSTSSSKPAASPKTMPPPLNITVITGKKTLSPKQKNFLHAKDKVPLGGPMKIPGMNSKSSRSKL